MHDLPRRHTTRRSIIGVGVAFGLLATLGIGATHAVDEPPVRLTTVRAPAVDEGGQRVAMLAEQAEARDLTALASVFATVDGVDLVLPGAQVLAVGFHETGAAFGMLPLDPGGTAIENLNPARVQPPATSIGPDYLVLPSRGRDGHATSAADLVLPAGAEVLSPVDGTVIRVVDYTLYGRYADLIIDVRPDTNPDVVVSIYHVRGAKVRAGDHLDAGVTPVADGAREFPFVSDIESVTGIYEPHVDVRVHRG